MKKRFFKNRLEYILFLPLAFLARVLPRNVALGLGAQLGWLSQYLLPKRARQARDNLRQAFPDMSATDLKQTIDDMFRHLGKSGMEMLQLDQFRTDEDVKKYFTFHGLENLKEAQALGKGLFILTGHLGFWEVGTFFLPRLGVPVDFVAKRMKNPYIDEYFRRLREAGGGQVIEAKHGARRIVKALGEQRAVAILLDQHISPPAGVKVNFFGRPAYTTPIISQIAMKLGTPVVPAFSYRKDDNHYDIVFEPMLVFDKDNSEEAARRNTQVLTDHIEAAVRKKITQWFWVHKRWRA